MAPPTLQYGLNLPNKKQQQPPSLGGKPNLAAGQKRKKTIFDSDSEDEGKGGKDTGNEIEITEIGGLEETKPPEPQPQSKESKKAEGKEEEEPASKRKPGLNGGKPAPALKPLKNSIFADDDDEDENTAENQEGENADGKSKSKPRFTGTNKDYANLSVLHSSTKHAKEAQDLDPSIYSYDAIYDSIHKKSKSNTADNANSGPRYMASLLRSAEIRKRDQLRARDRKLQREREAEGDEFADKEKFVTAAYKAQMEEMRRIEEEEKRKEQEEEEKRRRNAGAGMVSFYRDMLARGEEKHGEAMRAAQEAAEKVKAGEIVEGQQQEEEEEREKTEAEIAAELNAKGANIILNDEGQVVDKRQLLSAGLNVPQKPKPKPSATTPSTTSTTATAAASRPGAGPSDAYSARDAQRARQTELIAKQLEERTRREEEAEAARQRELAERLRSRKTESEVSSARERYLARKREREEAAAREREQGKG